ncbi:MULTISPECIES: NAD(P)-binding domain-containing protein [unclassified Pseudomonas]|uniref:pyrroline-5-carboxylate reductase family protein n=1 Tax=unclassified Pseudomonas TaxID=196821 RepID=UPI001472A2A7|nr:MULTISPECIES: NAD(P)-binding domain-containing protein [unclassified Pseudomonas]NMX90949.1 NAD(P)-binding domain-containing protein [Pseudomonas sp. WS 5086]NMY45447.1 NAD(P)-binding domain-containing protein [Pseudomonas sp. WS 5027]
MNTSSRISIVIVGAGHMGSALALGLKNSNLNIFMTVIEPDPIRRATITIDGVCTQESMPELKNTNILLLAIPPQAFFDFTKNCEHIKKYSGLVISVMAGLTISSLNKAIYTTQICRAMPNISCANLEGMTACYYSTKITNTNRTLTNQLFSSLGKCLTLKKESLIDSATALIGGGPAYVAYFATALFNFAISNGLDKKTRYL